MNIKSVILQGEGERVDFKNRISSEAKIAKTLVAFANRSGGRLLIGVADDGNIKGVKNEDEERYLLERASNLYCKPAVDLRFEEVFTDDKLILIATVEPSATKPHYALGEDGKWWVYVRVQDKSILAGKVVVDVLKRQTNGNGVFINYSEKEKAMLTFLQDHPQSEVPELGKALSLSRRKTQQLLVNLILAGLIKIEWNGKQESYSSAEL